MPEEDDMFNSGIPINETILENNKFRHTTDYDWKDISTEEFRAYIFPGGCTVYIYNPLKLHVSESGGHRIFDNEEICHYIPPKWIHLYWIVKEGRPHFSF